MNWLHYLWMVPTIIGGGYALGRFGHFSTPAWADPPLGNPSLGIVVRLEEKSEEWQELERECSANARWDSRNLEGLLQTAEKSRVVMFGIDHGESGERGDKRDGDFVAKMLPSLQRRGFNYLAIEAPPSLNAYRQRSDFKFELEARKVFGSHWAEFGPVIQKARRLGMRLLFYDDPKLDISNEREQAAFNIIKSTIFDKDSRAKVVVYSGAAHAYPEPHQVSFLDPRTVKPLRCFLDDYFEGRVLDTYLRAEGREGESKVVGVYLQPEEERTSGFSYNFSFYQGKKCPEELMKGLSARHR